MLGSKKNYLFILIFFNLCFADSDLITINANKLPLEEFVKITATILNKNFLISKKLDGDITFTSNSLVHKSELINILKTILKSKDLEIVEYDNFYSIEKNTVIAPKILENKIVNEIIFLNNINGKDLIALLSEFKFGPKNNINSKINFYEESNSLLFVGLQEELDALKNLIKKLDIEKQQVYVKAKIIELSENKTKEIGVKYNLEKLKMGSSSALSLAADFGGSAEVLSSIALPVISDGVLLGASVKFLQSNSALDVVSEPSLLCLNNKESVIYVGETRSVKSGSTTGSSSTETFIREDIGLRLIVKPRITNDQKVNLEISAILEDIKNEKGVNDQPDTTKKEVKTLAIVSDGQSVILGGLIKSKNEIINQKVPFFGDIPFLGNLFKNKLEQSDKINLVIILTPYIVNKSEDLPNIGAKISELAKIEDELSNKILQSIKKN